MRKLALILFTLVTLFILPSNTSAQEACVLACPSSDFRQSGPATCTNDRGESRSVALTCSAGKSPSTSDPSTCVCNPTRPAGTQSCTAECPGGTTQINAAQCVESPGKTPVNMVGICPAGFSPNKPFDLISCSCIKDETPPQIIPPVPAPVPGDGTRISTPSAESKGVRCEIDSGSVQDSGSGIMTAIGCIPTEPQRLVQGLLRVGTLAGGGIAFLLMLLAALQMITAEGNPNVIKTSQEKFYSAIIGLLLIIFSVLLLQVIGVDLLGLQGFSR